MWGPPKEHFPSSLTEQSNEGSTFFHKLSILPTIPPLTFPRNKHNLNVLILFLFTCLTFFYDYWTRNKNNNNNNNEVKLVGTNKK
jgi:hypothetical protein